MFYIPLLIYYVWIPAKHQSWGVLAGVVVCVLGILYYEIYYTHGGWEEFRDHKHGWELDSTRFQIDNSLDAPIVITPDERLSDYKEKDGW